LLFVEVLAIENGQNEHMGRHGRFDDRGVVRNCGTSQGSEVITDAIK
jgi:hypothetical protein